MNFATGGEPAFKRFFERYYPLVYRTIYAIIQSKEQTEELSHDLFLSLWMRRAELEQPLSWEGYLARAAMYKGISYRRKKGTFPPMLGQEALQSIFTTLPNPEESLATDEWQQRLLDALLLLPPQCQLIFRLSRFEGRSYQQIADELALSPKTVENQIGKALGLLRKWLLLGAIIGTSLFFSSKHGF